MAWYLHQQKQPHILFKLDISRHLTRYLGLS
jgi:hypothetical protein